MGTNYTYQEALDELQTIVEEIESGKTDIDELTSKIRRAASLIQICKTKLTASEEEVEKLLADLEENQPDATED